MRSKLSAIIIDPKKDEHDYNDIYTTEYYNGSETHFDLTVLTSSDGILSRINQFRGFDCLITIGEDIDFSNLSPLTFEIRKKWVHLNEFDGERIANSIVSTFLVNINRDRTGSELFSIFTCTFKTTRRQIETLYNSLLNQTYRNWNWWILDDSPQYSNVTDYLMKLHDPRIFIIKNVSDHGSIGFNKHVIASACDGDYLVEVDHDDELTADCLRLLKKAFDTYPDSDFVYSYAMEEMDGEPITYGGEFALGQGRYEEQEVNGVTYTVATTPDVTALTLRHIVGLPNHVRCWRKEFYHRIGGHNMELSVLDDMDILIRTYLHGKICKIPKVLYIQHEGSSSDANGRGSTTQGSRLPEIMRVGVYLKHKYDKEIHEKILAEGHDDYVWDEKEERSRLDINRGELEAYNYTLTDFD